MPRDILQQMDFMDLFLDGFEQTLETGSERIYWYSVPQPFLTRARRVLESLTGVEYVITGKFNYNFSED